MEHVEGKQKKCKVKLYTLSTCIWCKKTKRHLKDLGVAFDYIDVDLLPLKERTIAEKEMDKWNSDSYPLIIVDEKECIRGYEPDEINRRFSS
jgi:glutaredoxin-like protein NrdH